MTQAFRFGLFYANITFLFLSLKSNFNKDNGEIFELRLYALRFNTSWNLNSFSGDVCTLASWTSHVCRSIYG